MLCRVVVAALAINGERIVAAGAAGSCLRLTDLRTTSCHARTHAEVAEDAETFGFYWISAQENC
jgi:hypothetical protein